MDKLYIHTEEIHNTKAADVIVPIISQLFSPKSVLDVGCGLGTWLKVFREKHNLNDILGLDGSYLDRSKLVINDSLFLEYDLRNKINLDRKFDVVLCLEVAEHIPEKFSGILIESLCNHSDTIVFSAAIPGQGGQNHVNEQWPEYWEKKFNSLGFKKSDLIRPFIWENSNVDIWYKQNIFVYSKNIIYAQAEPKIAVIHPELWILKVRALEKSLSFENNFEKGSAGIKRSFYALFNAILNKLK